MGRLHAATIFLGAFLLFQVQPLLTKLILPWFGGGPEVWTTCAFFVQAMLFAGYAYAHGVAMQAIRLARSQGNTELADKLQRRLRQYNHSQPYRDQSLVAN